MGITNPVLDTNTGIMTWTPSHDGLYALQFTASDQWGNTNILDIIFDVSEDPFSPYFVELRDAIGGAVPNTTQDIFNPAPKSVIIGQSIVFGLWAYSPGALVTQITYTSFAYPTSSTIIDTCDGTQQYCEIQLTYQPLLGHTDTSICFQVFSSDGGRYVGAPSDPTNFPVFCVEIQIEEVGILIHFQTYHI